MLLAKLAVILFSAFYAGGVLPDEIDKDEIIRRGEWVEQVGVIRDDQQHSIEAAFQTPPDDSNKWYISVISTQGCKYCEKLKYDFENDSVLRSWVNVAEPAKSWAHYELYQYEDETQKDHFNKIRIKGFPTLLIQPPRNGEFGSNATVVWQKTGYDGNTEKLSREMSNAIKRYVAAINDERQRNPKEMVAESTETVLPPDENKKFSATPETEEVRASGAVPISDTIGVEPPFTIPNKDEYNGRNVNIPPEVTGALTKRELHDLLPDADEEFIRTQLALNASREEALRAWAAHKETFSWNRIIHILVMAFVALVVIGFVIVGLIIAAIVVRYAYAHIYSDKPVKKEVIHEVEHHTNTGTNIGGVNLTPEQIAAITAAIQKQQTEKMAQSPTAQQNKPMAQQVDTSLIL